MNSIREHLNGHNLHHAYLIEGEREEAVSEIFGWLKEAGFTVSGNPDFVRIPYDILKIEDALYLRGMSIEKSVTGGKKVFLISANGMTNDAQGVLLKMFEEPTNETHFFMIVPDVGALLPTVRSRFYVISTRLGNHGGHSELFLEAEKFISMRPKERVDYLKEFLSEDEDENEDLAVPDSSRAKTGRFLNELEAIIGKNVTQENIGAIERIFEARRYLRMPGSSAKTLMESVALAIPNN